jgi:hypothetical protein
LTENLTSVRPGGGPTPVDSPGSQNIATAPGGATAAVNNGVPPELLRQNSLLTGFALGGLAVLTVLVYVLWTEYRLADLHLRDMKAAMLAHGMDPNPHMPRESP